MRRDGAGTRVQHNPKSSTYHMAKPRRSDGYVSKVVGSTPGEPLRVQYAD